VKLEKDWHYRRPTKHLLNIGEVATKDQSQRVEQIVYDLMAFEDVSCGGKVGGGLVPEEKIRQRTRFFLSYTRGTQMDGVFRSGIAFTDGGDGSVAVILHSKNNLPIPLIV
jgi:hypothetical protein